MNVQTSESRPEPRRDRGAQPLATEIAQWMEMDETMVPFVLGLYNEPARRWAGSYSPVAECHADPDFAGEPPAAH